MARPDDDGAAFERDYYQKYRLKTRLAYFFGAICLLIALVSVSAVRALLPLKELVPIVTSIDEHGYANVRSKLGTVDVDSQEAIVKSLIWQYVRDRETYDFFDNAERIDVVHRSSAGQAKDSLEEWYRDGAEHNPVRLYKNKVRVVVRVLSIVTDEPRPGETGRSATIRFKRVWIDKGRETKARHYVVRLTYLFEYEKELTLDMEWLNPLRFTVTNYRKDEELVTGVSG